MNLVKPAVPEGFATIRTRGLTRSTSRAEQVAASRRSAGPMKAAGSGPLYEHNGGNGLAYKSTSATLICVPPPVPPRTTSELTMRNDVKELDEKNSYRDEDDIYSTATLTYETFKPLKSPTLNSESSDYVNLGQSTDCLDRLNYDFEMPPLKSPQYITELKLIQSKAMESGSLFSRPDSPPYSKIRHSYRSSTPESCDCSSGSSTYSNPTNSGKNSSLSGFLGQEETAKPPPNPKSLSLQYRKSYSSSRSEIIYEESKKLINGSQSSDTDSGYDGSQSSYSKIHKSAELLNVVDSNGRLPAPRLGTRGCSTLGHSRDVHIAGNGYPRCGESKSTPALDETGDVDVDVGDRKPEKLLEQKVGDQTTLRSKPVIPWYELAIRKDHRQSCPPLQTHVVEAFEQSLINVSQKLQKLTVSKDQKGDEIQEMRQTIELLRQQSAGIAATQLLALSSAHGTTTSGTTKTTSKQPPPPPPSKSDMKRHRSADSMNSISSSGISGSVPQDKPKKKGGLRLSLTRAFSRGSKDSKSNRPVSQHSNPGSVDGSLQGYRSHEDICASPPLSPTMPSPPDSTSPVQNVDQQLAYDLDGNPVVEHLVKQLRQKELVLTDIRMEALTTASQVENLKDTVMKMRQEMINLKHNNERLQHMVTRRSISGSDASLRSTSPSSSSAADYRRHSAATEYLHGRPMFDVNLDECDEDSMPPAPAPEPPPEPLSPAFIADLSPSVERPSIADGITALPGESQTDHIEGKKIAIAVYLGQMDQFSKYLETMNESGHLENGKIKQNEFTIAFTYISGKTAWQSLDYIVGRSFRDFLERVDPSGNLGLNTESIASYHLGEARRSHELYLPELLPYGYIIGHVDTLYICLRGVSNVALDNLIIKNMVLRYKSSAVVDPRRSNPRDSTESIGN
ncbi:protein sickie-like [Malaya genurostris]|uniref:protein sickie-like n=1 Tax=Malaya genurostris TaxID=325434 RepID=UPI0026F37F93|nr:protein sickie-like [Malaya genurostris]XP_058453556.1 protein sickie-like [Malaya genurostris]